MLNKESLAEFTEGARHQMPSAFDLKIVALDYIALGSYADADKWLTRSLQKNQHDEQAWYYLARTKYNENRFAEAIQGFQQCLKFDAKSVKYEDNLGLAFAALGKHDEAIAAFKHAIEWQTDSASTNVGPYLNMGSLLLDMDRVPESVSFLQKAVGITPQNSKAHELLGKAFVRLNNLAEARVELEKAVSLSPQVASLHCMLGPVYRKQGFADKAKGEFEKCSAQASANPSLKNPH